MHEARGDQGAREPEASWMALATEGPRGLDTVTGCTQCVRLWGVSKCAGLCGDMSRIKMGSVLGARGQLQALELNAQMAPSAKSRYWPQDRLSMASYRS